MTFEIILDKNSPTIPIFNVTINKIFNIIIDTLVIKFIIVYAFIFPFPLTIAFLKLTIIEEII